MKSIDESNFDSLKEGQIIERLTENGKYFPYKIKEIFNKDELHFEQGNHNDLNSIVGNEKTIPVMPAPYSKEEIISSKKWFVKK